MQITCTSCQERYPANTRKWVCRRCGGLLEITDVPAFDPARIETTVGSIWRYRAFLPLPENAEPVSMGEGYTPLVEARIGNRPFHAKLDFMMPTGSFKDRGTAVLVSALHVFGYGRVVEDSSGNAAASLSAYAARSGMQADIYVPAHASPAKLVQIQVYGAHVHKVEGPRENAALAVQEAARQGEAYYASHYYNPFALAGMQTTAWEIWEQLGHRAPAAVVAPVGHGTNFLGLTRGFQALCAAGLIDKIPRMFAAQADKVAPLVRAFERGLDETPVTEPERTVAEGIAINRPVHGAELLRALKASGGAAVAVSEQEIVQARIDLARTGLYVEPTSATAVAALLKIDETALGQGPTVVTLTGSGLKST